MPGTNAGPEEDSSSLTGEFNHSSNPEFFNYYAIESESEATQERFRRIRELVQIVAARIHGSKALKVADIGCGAGTMSCLWAEQGHAVSGLDISAPLVDLARDRAAKQGYSILFDVGSATAIPWADASFDVCLAPELLEHVADWQGCLDEFTRILRPGGVLYLSTTNVLCPKQEEFRLPVYSWYPGFLKRRFERLARTTTPEIANFATYPAVNWFTYYGLCRELRKRNFANFLDRFDIASLKALGAPKRLVLSAITLVPPIRFCAHVLCEGTMMIAIKKS